jgi:bifunctional non-homologous end joining protein LigD
MVVDTGFRVIAGQELTGTSPGRVLYPKTGPSKAQVLDYYEKVAPFCCRNWQGRPATRKR